MFGSSLFRRASARLLLAAAASASLGISAAFAGPSSGFATSVVSFNQGTGLPANYFNDPASALGAPSAVVGAGSVFPNVLDPFSPAFGKSEIVVLGHGGQLTLKLGQTINVSNAPQIGVISNVGLIDSSYPNGVVGPVAGTFGGGTADVRVSSDDKTWADLGNVTFNLPGTAWSKLSNPYETAPTAADVAADFSKPFSGKLSDFNGKNFQQVMNLLGGSAGGTWLNVSGTNLKTISYIQIENPTGSTGQLAIDSILEAASSAAGGGGGGGPSAVPLPPAAPIAALMLAVGVVLRLRSRTKA